MHYELIRLGQSTIDFARTTADTNDVRYETYRMNQGISLAANLREALASSTIGTPEGRVLVMVGTPVMLVPVDDFNDNDADTLYRHAYPSSLSGNSGNSWCSSSEGVQTAIVGQSVVPTLDVVALFAIDKDVHTVVTDRFVQAKFMPAMQPLWTYLSSLSGNSGNSWHSSLRGGNVLHVCFHDGQMSAFAVRNNHVRFCNSFHVSRANDAAYLTLNAWTQMGMDAEHDVVDIIGTPPEGDRFAETIRRYVRRVDVRRLADEFALPATAKEMPVDMQAFIAHGR